MTTALAAVGSPELPPVRWRRLGWVAWRRYRPLLVTAIGMLLLVALFLVIRGLQMRHDYAAVRECTPAASAACGFAFSRFRDTYGNIGPIGGMLVFVPGLIGAFAGAPLLAREFETGTYRYAWTQGVGRTRWATALLIPGAAAVITVLAGLGALYTWYYQPLIASGVVQRLHPSIFPVTGIVGAGWATLGFSIGVLAGTVIRRVVPALVATLAAWTGVAFIASHLRDYDYLAPLVTRSLQLPARDNSIDQWWTHGGVDVGQATLNHVLQAAGAPTLNGGNIAAGPGQQGIDPIHYLLAHGFTQWTSFQPDNRYWTFQAIESGWLLLLSVALLAATLWFIHRRNA
jgi:hypothetical protein